MNLPAGGNECCKTAFAILVTYKSYVKICTLFVYKIPWFYWAANKRCNPYVLGKKVHGH